MKYDVIIAGGGLGGLTAGAVLSKKGKKVLLLEQHYMAGGAATVFKRKNINIEVGLHEMDYGERGYDIKRDLFDYLELNKRIELISLPETWHVCNKDIHYNVPEGVKEAEEYFISQFPNEACGIKKYFRKLKSTSYTMGKLPYDMNILEFILYPVIKLPRVIYYYFNQKSVGEVLDSLIKDDKLKRLLNTNLVYYHDNPYEFSWHYHAMAQYNYYNGAKYIKGGSASLSNALVDIIKENGGEVKTFCNVEKINVENGKVKGVTYRDRKAKEDITVESDYVIANCSPNTVYNSMLDEKYKDKSLDKFKESVSLYTVYIIFKKNVKEVYKDSAYSTFIGTNDEYSRPFSEMSKGIKDIPVENREFVFVNYGAIDSGLKIDNDDERAVGVFCGASYLDEWDNLSSDEYSSKKEHLAEELFKRAEKYFPDLKSYVEYYEVSTPKTVKRYLKSTEGSAYGYVNNNYLRKGRVPRFSRTVKNLLFTGAYAFPGGGFTGVLISGYMAALNLLKPQWRYIFTRTALVTIFFTALSTFPKWSKFILDLFK